MKKNKKGILLILLTICLLFPFNPKIQTVQAVQADEIDYISVNETKSFTTSDFTFSNLQFIDNTNTSV